MAKCLDQVAPTYRPSSPYPDGEVATNTGDALSPEASRELDLRDEYDRALRRARSRMDDADGEEEQLWETKDDGDQGNGGRGHKRRLSAVHLSTDLSPLAVISPAYNAAFRRVVFAVQEYVLFWRVGVRVGVFLVSRCVCVLSLIHI